MARHVCLTCIEIFPDRIHGGFGRATRAIGRALVGRGLDVSVVVPRRSPERPDRYTLDGMTVHQFPPARPWKAIGIYRHVDADVYHSQDTSLGTWLALRARPDRRHLITFRDPMDRHDWAIETRYAGHRRAGWRLYRAFIDGPLVGRAVSRATGLYCAAEFLRDKVAHKYRLPERPGFLPTPVDVPASVRKAPEPTVCFVGRWEARKRPERFFELARQRPDVHFIAVGGAQDAERDAELRRAAGRLANVELTGFVDQFASGTVFDVLGRSWILVNTSAREGLPNTFLEACAHRCAILSGADPDGFASRFGRVAGPSVADLLEGLDWLLGEDRWRRLGERGHAFVAATFETRRAVDAHLAAYRL